MKSYEVLKQAIAHDSVKALAAKMGLSTSLVYKWCQEAPADDDPDQSGAKNPLDRVAELYRHTGDPAIISWICEQGGGYFVENPKNLAPAAIGPSILGNTQTMIRKFSDLLDAVSRAIEDDSDVDTQEAERIRREWEQLKSKAETFVLSCEQGAFRLPGDKK